MGMVGAFTRLRDEELSRLVEDPELLEKYFEGADIEGFEPIEEMGVDKAWYAIHFLLTGTAASGRPPLNFIATGGAAIGDLEEWNSRGFTSAEVRTIASALEAVTAEALMKRFDPAALVTAEIYPPHIWAEPGDSTRWYVSNHYDELRAFILAAADKGQALIVSIQ